MKLQENRHKLHIVVTKNNCMHIFPGSYKILQKHTACMLPCFPAMFSMHESIFVREIVSKVISIATSASTS